MKKTIITVIISFVATALLTSCVWLTLSYRSALIGHEQRISAIEQFLVKAQQGAKEEVTPSK